MGKEREKNRKQKHKKRQKQIRKNNSKHSVPGIHSGVYTQRVTSVIQKILQRSTALLLDMHFKDAILYIAFWGDSFGFLYRFSLFLLSHFLSRKLMPLINKSVLIVEFGAIW